MDYPLLQIDRPIPIADERVGVQVKLWDPLIIRAIPERFRGGVSLRRGAISSVRTYTVWPKRTLRHDQFSVQVTTVVSS